MHKIPKNKSYGQVKVMKILNKVKKKTGVKGRI